MVSPPIKLLACIASATKAMVGLNDELCALNLKIFGELSVDSAHVPQAQLTCSRSLLSAPSAAPSTC